ncbi:hypothetical protein GGP93_002984 [Salinibacter ruber]|nr:hypothetical protein [Salinibacter ruber]
MRGNYVGQGGRRKLLQIGAKFEEYLSQGSFLARELPRMSFPE